MRLYSAHVLFVVFLDKSVFASVFQDANPVLEDEIGNGLEASEETSSGQKMSTNSSFPTSEEKENLDDTLLVDTIIDGDRKVCEQFVFCVFTFYFPI
jgi:hypothetical protein